MNNIAIGIVLLPNEEMIESVIQLNDKLNNDQLILSKECNLPHISLVMGVVKSKDIRNIKLTLQEIANSFFFYKINY